MARDGGVEFLPDGDQDEFDNEEQEIDYDTLRVNFSQDEASSTAREYEPIPAGTYPVKVTDIQLARSKSKKNPNKPYWKMTLQIDEGNKYEGRNLWTNVMLFEGALFTAAQLFRSLDFPVDGRIPHPDRIIEASERGGLAATVKRVVDKYKIEQAEEEGFKLEATPYKNEVGGFKRRGAKASPASPGAIASGAGSIMP